MQNGANKRLANLKTKAETGLDYVMLKLDVISPFGKKKLKAMRPFYPGDEQLLNEELDRIQDIVDFIKAYPMLKDKIQEIYMELKDSTGTIERSENSVLSVVEIFEVKSLLLQMRRLLKITKEREIVAYRPACGCISQAMAGREDEGAETSPADIEANREVQIPEKYFLEDTEELLDILAPRKDRRSQGTRRGRPGLHEHNL